MVTGQLAQQNKEIQTATASLMGAGESAPAELAPAVEQLTATLKAVQDLKTSPQERDEVTDIAQQVTSALAVIINPETPPELREQLTAIVRQVASAVEGSRDPGVPPERRAATISTVEQATSALEMIGDPETPPELRTELILIIDPLTSSMAKEGQSDAQEGPSDPPASPAPKWNQVTGEQPEVAGAAEVASDPKTPPPQRLALAKAAARAASSLPKLSDSGGSQEDGAKAQEVYRQQSAEMKKQKEAAVSAQGVPDVPLGKAAEVCTNGIFSSVSDRALGWTLKGLLPQEWEIAGVEDFWKAQEKGNDSLEVLAQLRNGDDADEPFNVGELTTRLAELIPAGDLFWAIGTPALHCLQAAWHLEQAGIAAGTWVQKAHQEKGDG